MLSQNGRQPELTYAIGIAPPQTMYLHIRGIDTKSHTCDSNRGVCGQRKSRAGTEKIELQIMVCFDFFEVHFLFLLHPDIRPPLGDKVQLRIFAEQNC